MSPIGKNRWTLDGGFTLLEMLLVIGVMALMMTLSFPLLKERLRENRLLADSREIAEVLSEARRYARRTGRAVTATMDLDARRVIGPGGAAASWSPDLQVSVEATAALMKPSTVNWVFFHDGTATGGAVTLSDGAAGPVTVHVDWLKGVSLNAG